MKTLVEKVGTTKTEMRILEVMTEKFDKNLSEKTNDMMNKKSAVKDSSLMRMWIR